MSMLGVIRDTPTAAIPEGSRVAFSYCGGSEPAIHCFRILDDGTSETPYCGRELAPTRANPSIAHRHSQTCPECMFDALTDMGIDPMVFADAVEQLKREEGR